MKVVVNKSICARSSQCSYLHPDLFPRDEEGYPKPPEDVAEEQREAAEEAVELCPVAALSIEE